MSNLIVLTFEDTSQANAAFEAIKKAQSDGHLKVHDTAIIVKEESGNVAIQNQIDTGVKWGAVAGGVFGLMLGSLLFPLASLAIGVIGGALVGKSMDRGLDNRSVQDLTEKMKPGSSALFLLVSDANPDIALALLRPFQGEIYQTTLPTEVSEALQRALK